MRDLPVPAYLGGWRPGWVPREPNLAITRGHAEPARDDTAPRHDDAHRIPKRRRCRHLFRSEGVVLLRRYLEATRTTQHCLGVCLRSSQGAVSGILMGRAISPARARQLEALTGVPVAAWEKAAK